MSSGIDDQLIVLPIIIIVFFMMTKLNYGACILFFACVLCSIVILQEGITTRVFFFHLFAVLVLASS